jgi:membrane protease YdiL (CAAX protease family)
LFTVLAFGVTRVLDGRDATPRPGALWSVNIAVAVAFGLAHLPATASLVAITPVVVGRAVLLNGVLGLGFGYLYWTRGLAAAMVAHLTADIALQLTASLL